MATGNALEQALKQAKLNQSGQLPTQTGLIGNALARTQQEASALPSGDISAQPQNRVGLMGQPNTRSSNISDEHFGFNPPGGGSFDGNEPTEIKPGDPIVTQQPTDPNIPGIVENLPDPDQTVTPTNMPVDPRTQVQEDPGEPIGIEEQLPDFTINKPDVDPVIPTTPEVTTPNFTGLLNAPTPATAPRSVSEEVALREAQATTPTAFTQDVAAEGLVEERLKGLLSGDSPFLAQARQRAEAKAARQGLTGSSIQTSAGEGAAIDRALPIASQDAKAIRDQALANQGAVNQNEMLSAQLATNVDLANVDAVNRLGLQNDAQNFRLTELQQQQAQQLQLTEYDYKNRVQLANLAQDFQLTQFEEQERINSGLSKQAYIQQKALLSSEFSNTLQLRTLENDFRTTLQQADLDNREALTRMQLDSQEIVSTNTDAAAFMRSNLASLTQLMADANIPNDELNDRISRIKEEMAFLQNGQEALSA